MLAIIPASGTDRDLVSLAAASLGRVRALDTLILGGPHPHGAKLDQAKTRLDGYAIAVTLDSDVVAFPAWAEWIRDTLSHRMTVACGAPRIDGAPGLHPSMLAMHADLFRQCPSFLPTIDGKDTGVVVSEWLQTQGELVGADAWVNGDGWWEYFGSKYFGSKTDAPRLWWHLGSGTASAWPGCWKFSYRAFRALLGSERHEEATTRYLRRRLFLKTAREALR